MTQVRLSRAAVADLDEIDEYTLKQFGLAQAARLREQFRETFRSLAQTPRLAPLKPAYDPPGKAFRYHSTLKRFTVIYEPTKGGVRIARILHAARDLARELEREAGTA